MPEPSARPPLSVSFLLKRGTLMGAALGLLAGLIALGVTGIDPAKQVAAIVFWRNVILIGAACGFLSGGIAAIFCGRGKGTKATKEQSERPGIPTEN